MLHRSAQSVLFSAEGERLRVVARRSHGAHLLCGRLRTGRVRGRTALLVVHAQPGRRLPHHVRRLGARRSEGELLCSTRREQAPNDTDSSHKPQKWFLLL